MNFLSDAFLFSSAGFFAGVGFGLSFMVAMLVEMMFDNYQTNKMLKQIRDRQKEENDKNVISQPAEDKDSVKDIFADNKKQQKRRKHED